MRIIALLLVLLSPLVASAAPLLDLSKAGFTSATHTDAGIAFAFDMGTKRVNWNKAAWSQHAFDKPRDLSGHAGLRLTVATDTPRTDAAVAVALQEADGSWHYYAYAVDLTQEANTRTIRFADFRPAYWIAPHTHGMPKDHFDQNQHFDPDAVGAIAIGCANSLGIGKVAFTLTSIELVGEPEAPTPVTINVTGKTLSVNGTTTIPGGLFGHFPGGASPDMRIGSHRHLGGSYVGLDREGNLRLDPRCKDTSHAVLLDVKGGDRYSSSGRLTNRNWQQSYRNWGLSAGRAHQAYLDDGKYNREVVYEWWNEPYLNWSNRTRKNFSLSFFDTSRAVEGGPVHLRVDGSIAPFLRWTKNYDAPPWNWTTPDRWRGGRNEKGQVVRGAVPPADVKDGQTFTHDIVVRKKDPKTGKRIYVKTGEQTLTAFTPWHVYDVTQFTFWSGQSQLKFYNEPMLAFARGLHETCPEAKFIAGWDFRPSEDHWAGFEMLYKPTIDAGIEHIHGVTDHDYGGDVTRMPANYEVIAAYGMAYHNKFLYSYNTECGENSDPSAIPAASQSMQSAGKKWLKCMWASRKIVHALAATPDKARSFTFHWFDKGAEGVAFNILKNMRGRLIQTQCPDPQIYVAAAIDGADPYLPREPYLPAGKELVIAVFNDHRDPREVSIPIAAPTGTTFTQLVVKHTAPDADGGKVHIKSKTHKAKGDTASWQGTVNGKSLVVLTLPLEGDVVGEAQVTRTQYFADDVLKRVHPGKEVDLRLRIPEAALKNARRATLRFVFEQLAEGEGTLNLAATTRDHRGRRKTEPTDNNIDLPACPTPVNVCWIREVEVDPAKLQTDGVLRFAAAEGHAGYLVCMASVMIEN